MIDIDNLEALAMAATPGPWAAVDHGSYDGKSEGWYVDTTAAHADIAPDMGGIQPNHWNADRGGRDMRFIAEANPVAVLDLIAEVRALREEKARLEFLIDNEAHVWSIGMGWHVTNGPSDDPQNLEPWDSTCQSAREAIDAARAKDQA